MTDKQDRLTQRSIELLELVKKYDKDRSGQQLGYFQAHDLAARAAQLIHSVTGSKSAYADQLRAAGRLKTAPLQSSA